jgi:hypothetical protein
LVLMVFTRSENNTVITPPINNYYLVGHQTPEIVVEITLRLMKLDILSQDLLGMLKE